MVATSEPRLIVALDYPEPAAALALIEQLEPRWCRLKVGFELFISGGPALVETLQMRGFEVFLDLKLHDIPNTVAAACRRAAALGVWMLTVHGSGGAAMIAAAREALEAGSDRNRPRLVAVTVLTSLTEAELQALGMAQTIPEQVDRLAGLALNAGADGLVCSPLEVAALRDRFGAAPLLVTPGIRAAAPSEASGDDQRRTLAAAQALAAGSSYLVIGRPITRAHDPAAALQQIADSLTLSNF